MSNTAKAAKPPAIPIIDIPGAKINSFRDLDLGIVRLEQQIKPIKDELKEQAVAEIIKRNSAPAAYPIDSVTLKDATGAMARVSFTSKYKLLDVDEVGNALEEIGHNLGEVAQLSYDAKIDATAFVGSDGEFDETKWNMFVKLVDTFAQANEIKNPLKAKPVAIVDPKFHVSRWSKFTPENQEVLREVVPNTVTITAL